MIFVNDEINSLAIQDNLSNEDIKNKKEKNKKN